MKINLTKQSGIYTLTSEQILPISLEKAWEFFTVPTNLDKITPVEMEFKITNNPPSSTYQGQIITYKIEILPLIKSNWITEITHFKSPFFLEIEHSPLSIQEKKALKQRNLERGFFVDEQRFGPYAMWHHEHHFEATQDGKVKMKDIVNFKLPFGILGDFLAGNFVKNKVKFIFENRFKILEEMFAS